MNIDAGGRHSCASKRLGKSEDRGKSGVEACVRRVVGVCLGTALALSEACASFPEPIESPMLITDNVELFRRTRFQELAAIEGQREQSWISFLGRRQALSKEHLAILDLRGAYARGDVKAMVETLERIPSRRPASRLFSAILENVNLHQQIRYLHRESKRVELPLNRAHLERGIPVVEVNIYGRRFSFLWDTGSTENIMSHELADELDLVLTDVHFPVVRDRDGYVVRLAAAHTTDIQMGNWKWSNFPWLISDLRLLNQSMKTLAAGIDGVLSPQLLLPESCFLIDRHRAMLELVADRDQCKTLGDTAAASNRMYAWNGEIYASVQILSSPWVGARLETGSSATFLRHDAVRYLPKGAIAHSIVEQRGEIARTLDKSIAVHFAGRQAEVFAIELEASRMTTGHDDLATIGADLLLRASDRLWVDFSSMSVGFLPPAPSQNPQTPNWDLDPGMPKFSLQQSR